MAITAAKTVSSGDFDGFLSPEKAAPFFEEVQRVSVVQSLFRKVPLGPSGVETPVVTGKMSAAWVNEAGQKPASEADIGLKSMQPKKIAAIAVVSAEVVRSNPGGYMDLIRPQVGEAFAAAFDSATLYGTATPFDATNGKPLNATTKTQALDTTDVHGSFVGGMRALVRDGKKFTATILDDVVEPELWDARDSHGDPIYVDLPYDQASASTARRGRLLARPSLIQSDIAAGALVEDTAVTVGFQGDFSQAVWGQVGGIGYDVSTEATVTINGSLVSLWEHNLLAIRMEAEYGWLMNDAESFVEVQYTLNETP